MVDSIVSNGKLIRVQNTNKPKFSNAKDNYLSVFLEDSDSKKERFFLFTERELKVAEDRATRNQ